MQSIRRKAYICKNCECVYADEPVTACDCMPDKEEYWIGYLEYIKDQDKDADEDWQGESI